MKVDSSDSKTADGGEDVDKVKKRRFSHGLRDIIGSWGLELGIRHFSGGSDTPGSPRRTTQR